MSSTSRIDVLASNGFTALTPHIHISAIPPRPTSPSTTRPSDPQLILLCAWLHAAPKHILKYVSQHQHLFPHTPILILQNNPPNMLYRSDATIQSSLSPAVHAVRSILSTTQPDLRGGILAHVFSNGGCHSLVHFASAFSASNPSTPLPISVLILDSAPSKMHYLRSCRAVASGLPRTFPAYQLGTIFVYFMIAIYTMIYNLGLRDISVEQARRALNDPRGVFCGKGVRKRVYLCSKSDDMVWYGDVVEHAEEARRVLGVEEGRRVEMVEFSGTKHVAHTIGKGNAERYWKVVTEAWGVVE